MRIATLIAAAVLGLTACSGTPAPTPTATVSAFSQTDVVFAQSMIPHHQQAVEMADLALDPQSGASAQVQQLATQIKAAQGPEITQMNDWMQQWGVQSAMPGMDHGGHDMTGTGMMTAKQMSDLSKAQGAEFDQMWLTMMIAHHEGAISMAQQVQNSANPQVAAMAKGIMAGQQQEITTMQEMLAGQ